MKLHYAISIVLIATAALGGYTYGIQPANAEKVVFAELEHARQLSDKLAALTGRQDFLTTMTQGRK